MMLKNTNQSFYVQQLTTKGSRKICNEVHLNMAQLLFEIEVRKKFYRGDLHNVLCRKTFHKSRYTKRNDNICFCVIAYLYVLYISTSRTICVCVYMIINYSDSMDLEIGLCKFSIFVPTNEAIYFVSQTYPLQELRKNAVNLWPY